MTAPLRLVLDTNVWLAWLAFDDPGIVVPDASRIYCDAACEAEFARVLAYERGKRTLDAAAQAACLARMRALVRAAEPGAAHALQRLPDCRDPDDQKFLRLALACGAHYLVTRDRALLELARRRVRRVPYDIVTPAAFSRLIATRSRGA